jgi:hypothetical protein
MSATEGKGTKITYLQQHGRKRARISVERIRFLNASVQVHKKPRDALRSISAILELNIAYLEDWLPDARPAIESLTEVVGYLQAWTE